MIAHHSALRRVFLNGKHVFFLVFTFHPFPFLFSFQSTHLLAKSWFLGCVNAICKDKLKHFFYTPLIRLNNRLTHASHFRQNLGSSCAHASSLFLSQYHSTAVPVCVQTLMFSVRRQQKREDASVAYPPQRVCV